MEVKKITEGYVVQTFKDGKCVGQKFVAGSSVDYEDQFGDVLPPEKELTFATQEIYQPFDMLQPNTEIVITVQGGLISDVALPDGMQVVVKDYDTDGSEDVETDKDGTFVRSEWG